MTKTITDNQILGELGETAIKKLVLEMQFMYDPRGRLEAGTDGIIELRDPKSGAPLGKLLGIQVKSTESGQYPRDRPQFRISSQAGRSQILAWFQYPGNHCPMASIRRLRLLEGCHRLRKG